MNELPRSFISCSTLHRLSPLRDRSMTTACQMCICLCLCLSLSLSLSLSLCVFAFVELCEHRIECSLNVTSSVHPVLGRWKCRTGGYEPNSRAGKTTGPGEKPPGHNNCIIILYLVHNFPVLYFPSPLVSLRCRWMVDSGRVTTSEMTARTHAGAVRLWHQ